MVVFIFPEPANHILTILHNGGIIKIPQEFMKKLFSMSTVYS